MSKNDEFGYTRFTSLSHERALILTWCLRDALQALRAEIESDDHAPDINDGNADLASSVDFQLDICGSFLDSDVNYLAPQSMRLIRRLATLVGASPDSVLGTNLALHERTAKTFSKAPVCV